MNLPVKDVIVKDFFLERLEPVKLFLDLEGKKFSGYLSLIIKGDYGFEESYVIFEKGELVGFIYFLPSYDIKLFGEKAFKYCLNCYGAKDGVLNIYNLTEDQIKLILMFNDKINYNKKINSDKFKKNKKHFLKNIKYNKEDLKELLKDKIQFIRSKKSIFDERGLDDLLNI
jgi:hypothetical protein